MNLKKCPLRRKTDLFGGLAINEKEVKGLHEIINLFTYLNLIHKKCKYIHQINR
jgi:hypothetical protein